MCPNYLAGRTISIDTTCRTQRAGRFSPVMINWNGAAFPARGSPSLRSAMIATASVKPGSNSAQPEGDAVTVGARDEHGLGQLGSTKRFPCRDSRARQQRAHRNAFIRAGLIVRRRRHFRPRHRRQF